MRYLLFIFFSINIYSESFEECREHKLLETHSYLDYKHFSKNSKYFFESQASFGKRIGSEIKQGLYSSKTSKRIFYPRKEDNEETGHNFFVTNHPYIINIPGCYYNKKSRLVLYKTENPFKSIGIDEICNLKNIKINKNIGISFIRDEKSVIIDDLNNKLIIHPTCVKEVVIDLEKFKILSIEK